MLLFDLKLVHLFFVIQTKTLMGEVMKNASFSLAETKFAMGDINHLVIQNVNKAQIKVRTKKDNVAGISVIRIAHRILSYVILDLHKVYNTS